MRNILYIFLSMICTFSGQSQNINADQLSGKQNEIEFKVKQLDEFINRFNSKENLAGLPIQNDSLSERKINLMSLFNHEDTTYSYSTTKSFINDICDNLHKTKLDYKDTNWYAKVSCSVKYKGKQQNLFLTLKNEAANNNGFKWVISGVYAPFINLKPESRDTIVFISPMNHELSFMGLFNVFSDSENIAKYASNDFEPDDLSVFFFLVKTKEIQYLKVNFIQYHFLQINNWIFTVDYFDRPSSNSGWLISSVISVKDSEKIEHKKNNLYLKQ